MTRRALARADIMPMADYEKIRASKRGTLAALRQTRRLEVGPHAAFYFENYDTMWLQVHEMLFIEKGGESQVADELAAYNPLIPQGRELVATVMFEIDQPDLRKRILGALGGVEHAMEIRVDRSVIKGSAEDDTDRTTAEGKASAVHFVRFPFTAEQVMAFRNPAAEVTVAITHNNYGHSAIMPQLVREELAKDFV